MYVHQISLFASQTFPLFGGAVYERLAEIYELPSIALLMKSRLQNDVVWPGEAQVYYLENMREQAERVLFQVRFRVSPEAGDFTSIFFSICASQVLNVTIQFPARGNRAASSKMIEILKSVVQQLHMPPPDVHVEVEGYMEMGEIRFIREKRLSGFVWIEGLQRYLHISEDPQRVKEVRKDMRRL